MPLVGAEAADEVVLAAVRELTKRATPGGTPIVAHP